MTVLTPETGVALQRLNTLGIAARAQRLLRITSSAQLQTLHTQPALLQHGFVVLGGGSNMVLTGDVQPLVLKMDIAGRALVAETAQHRVVQAGAGEHWHRLVEWTLQQGWPGLENLALIPGTVGSAPVQNIGAYGMELQDVLHSVDAVHIATGATLTLSAAQCQLGYRDSIFKHPPQDGGLAGEVVITHVRLALPQHWQPRLTYHDLQRSMADAGITHPTAQQVFDSVVRIRQAKLPDPAVIGNAGSFFKNPIVSATHCQRLLQQAPHMVNYPLPDGTVKLAAGWLIEACGWRGKHMGNAGVYPQQALVLVNRQHETGTSATGADIMALAHAIQTSVQERFGVWLEPEPVIL